MSTISWPSDLLTTRLARLAAIGLVATALIACGDSLDKAVGSVRKVTGSSSEQGTAEAGEGGSKEAVATKAVVVLMIEGQKGCTNVAKGLAAAYVANVNSLLLEEELNLYVQGELRPEIEISNRRMRVIGRLLPDVEANMPPQVVNPIKDMHRELKRLCDNAQQSANAPTMDRFLAEQANAFRGAEVRVAKHLRVSNKERRQILRHFSEEIYGPGATGAVGVIYGDEMSEEERQRKEKAWQDHLAEQERLERQKRERLAAREAAARKRLQEQAARGDTGPMVGLNEEAEARRQKTEAPPVDDRLRRAMIAWHRSYEAKAVGVKRALGRYAQIERDLSTREIRACQEVAQAVAEFLAVPETLNSPDPAPGQALKTAYTAYYHAAKACLYKKAEERDSHLTTAGKALAAAGAGLKPYGLAP